MSFDPVSTSVVLRNALPKRKDTGPLTELARGRAAARLEAEHRATVVAAEEQRRATLVATERERRATITALIKGGIAGLVVTDKDAAGRTLTVRIPAAAGHCPLGSTS